MWQNRTPHQAQPGHGRYRGRRAARALLAAGLLAIAGLLSLPVQAALIVVETDDDNEFTEGSRCTLRSAVASINAGSNQDACLADTSGENGPYGTNDRIAFAGVVLAGVGSDNGFNQAGGDGVITLVRGELQITRSVTISGPGRNLLAIDGDAQSRVFQLVNPGTDGVSADVVIRDITITNGSADTAGGVQVDRNNLELLRVRITDSNGGGSGGCMATVLRPDNRVRIVDSLLQGCTASSGGGMDITGGSHLVLRSTITDNEATNSGGGIALVGTVSNLSIINSTVAGNRAETDPGITDLSGQITLVHSTITDNESTGSNPDVQLSVSGVTGNFNTRIDNSIIVGPCDLQGSDAGSVLSGQNNLLTDNTCSSVIGGNGGSGTPQPSGFRVNNANTTRSALQLAELDAFNVGGFTPIHALLTGSVAIDAAAEGPCLAANDANPPGAGGEDQTGPQFGNSRNLDGTGDGNIACDVGAFEVKGDFGDAPDSYGTSRDAEGFSSGGARHFATGVILGTIRDAEADGFPSANASGDNGDGSNDEDGLAAGITVSPGQPLSFSFTVTATGAGTGSTDPVLNVWIDGSQDGEFGDNDHLVENRPVTNGINTIDGGVVPLDTPLGVRVLRARVCSLDDASGNPTNCNSPTGIATDGEVEDHLITVVAEDEPEPEPQPEPEPEPAPGGGGGGGGGSLGLGLLGMLGLLGALRRFGLERVRR
ncbi:GEVED domain-containing protein [Panacagrimonas sp.]|uniref:GEVED domain-containing protein n=1 Tax=Panacagrimonas sp. TaxID=2480088 RepID=UPI003B51EF96